MTYTSVINTDKGPVRGYVKDDCCIFKGIPFAAPPVGDLRFKAPQPHAPWTEVLTCDTFSCQCPQTRIEGGFYFKEFYSEPGDIQPSSEDCLYLNIWSPDGPEGPSGKESTANADDSFNGNHESSTCVEDSAGLPVLFWIHGGAFNHGAGSEKEFDGEAYARRGVILVTINYRVGSFGFLSLPELAAEDEHGSTGNYGILDQIFALQWVKNNIAAFGGDPAKVTIAGQSAGAMSVQALLSSPLTTGLFRGAIPQSGGGIDAGLTKDLTREDADKWGRNLMQLLGVNTLEDLRKVPADDIVKADGELARKFLFLPLRPVIDGYLLKETYHDVVVNGHLQDVPCMIGSTLDDIGASHKDDVGGALEKAAVLFATARSKVSERPTYIYRFDRRLPGDGEGAFHSSELWYMFGTLDRCWRPLTPHDFDLSRTMLSEWTAFVKGSAPFKAYTAEDPFIRIYE